MSGRRRRRAAALGLAAAGWLAGAASSQCLIDRFPYPASTTIPSWSVEFGGDWRANGRAAESDIRVGWQYLLRDTVQDRDCVVETVVKYDGNRHLQAAGPIARATLRNHVLRTFMVKSQDNDRAGTGKFNTGYLYFYESPLVFQRLAFAGFATPSTVVRTRMLVMTEADRVRVMGFFDTDQDGVWDLRLTGFSPNDVAVTGGVGLHGFSRCQADDWKYWNACLYARNPGVGPGETLELVARSQPKAVFYAASSLFNTGFSLGGKTVPLYPDPLLALSRAAPAVFQSFTGVFDARGDAVLKVAVPDERALLGVVFYTAFVTLSTTNPGQVDEVSSDVQVRIGG